MTGSVLVDWVTDSGLAVLMLSGSAAGSHRNGTKRLDDMEPNVKTGWKPADMNTDI